MSLMNSIRCQLFIFPKYLEVKEAWIEPWSVIYLKVNSQRKPRKGFEYKIKVQFAIKCDCQGGTNSNMKQVGLNLYFYTFWRIILKILISEAFNLYFSDNTSGSYKGVMSNLSQCIYLSIKCMPCCSFLVATFYHVDIS